MANDSYLRQLTRGVVLTSLLAGSATGAGCALHNTYNTQQSSIDVKLWRAGSDTAFVEYDGNVFYLWGMPSLQGEDAITFLDRVTKMIGKEEVKPGLLRKGADLLTIINGDKVGFESYVSDTGETRQIRLKVLPPITTLTPADYWVTIPTQWNSIKQVQDYYKTLVQNKN
ncbi:MAG TPA: hypothetical protein VJJ52_00805 [Candidatus Nanoarchaeia archaeon]|nr:hypothetical protein [Candidatus Nanoarchaeia archaeon]